MPSSSLQTPLLAWVMRVQKSMCLLWYTFWPKLMLFTCLQEVSLLKIFQNKVVWRVIHHIEKAKLSPFWWSFSIPPVHKTILNNCLSQMLRFLWVLTCQRRLPVFRALATLLDWKMLKHSCPTFALSKCHACRSHTSSAVLARGTFLRAVLTTHTLHSSLFDSIRHSYWEWNETGLQSLSQRKVNLYIVLKGIPAETYWVFSQLI